MFSTPDPSTAAPSPLGVFCSLLQGVHTAIGVVTLGRGLGVHGVAFESGVAVGAAIGMLFAPRPGIELRRTLLARITF